jgi:hypothetical protein
MEIDKCKANWDHVLNWVICQITDKNLSEDQKQAYGRVLAVMASKEQGKNIYSEVTDEPLSRKSVG